MEKQIVLFRDLGKMGYKQGWAYQERLMQENLAIKAASRNIAPEVSNLEISTLNYLLFVEHPPVYTLGKSGKMEHVLINEQQLEEKGIEFFQTNRGGDITF